MSAMPERIQVPIPTTPPDFSALVSHLRVRSSHLKQLGYNSLSKIVGIAGNV
jgi:hypothetical protein